MRFGVFYELQLPKPWTADDEHRLIQQALDQIELADKIGIDYAWAVEHHFLDEYSHCSSPEIFLAAAAQRTKNIRLGHGIRQVIPNYNHPARTAEGIAFLDLVSNGRAEFGIGEGATRLELHGFGIAAKEKRALSLEAAEQIANMMVMTPYPGFEGKGFSMPCRNVIPKPLQKPHPPMWMACTNRDTIKIAASLGLGALGFAFVDPDEAKGWSKAYYDIIKSDQCVPLGHRVNANIAMVSAFSLHEDRQEAIRRGQVSFEFFVHALRATVTQDTIPGHTKLWDEFQDRRGAEAGHFLKAVELGETEDQANTPGIGTPKEFAEHARIFEAAGVDQIVLLQQVGRNAHANITEALNLFGREVLPQFKPNAARREAEKAEELKPYIEAALKRKKRMMPLKFDEIPVVRASVKQVQVNAAKAGAPETQLREEVKKEA